MTTSEEFKLLVEAQPYLDKLPANAQMGRVFFPGPDGVGGQAYQFKMQDGCWVFDQQLNTAGVVMGQPLPPAPAAAGAVDVQAHTKKAVVRLWGLARALKRDPDEVRQRFVEVWGEHLGSHIHDKLHYHYEDEIDAWWCSLDERNREKFLTHPKTDFL